MAFHWVNPSLQFCRPCKQRRASSTDDEVKPVQRSDPAVPILSCLRASNHAHPPWTRRHKLEFHPFPAPSPLCGLEFNSGASCRGLGLPTCRPSAAGLLLMFAPLLTCHFTSSSCLQGPRSIHTSSLFLLLSALVFAYWATCHSLKRLRSVACLVKLCWSRSLFGCMIVLKLLLQFCRQSLARRSYSL